MSSAVATIRPAAPTVAGAGSAATGDEWNDTRVEFIRRTYCGGAPDAIAATFIELCRRRRLAPEEKHVYLTKRGNDWVIQTGIDGYRLIADRTGRYAGSDPPVYDTDDAERPNTATVTVWKLVDGHRCPFAASARWAEYAPKDTRTGFMWVKMPYLMLAKCAEALALRKAFPAELAGVYTDSEMDQAEPAATVLDAPRPAPAPIRATATVVEIVDAETGEIYDVETDAAPDPTPAPSAPPRSAPPAERASGDKPAVSLGALHAEIKAKGYEGNAVHEIAHDLGCAWAGVASLTDLTPRSLAGIRGRVQKSTRDQLDEAWSVVRDGARIGTPDGALPGMPVAEPATADRWTG